MSSPDVIKDLFNSIQSFLNEHNTISVATTDNQELSSATVFYVSDEKLNIFFISFPDSRHIQHILKNAKVAATINEDVKDWLEISGLQLKGKVHKVTEQDQEFVLDIYKKKFSYIETLLRAPKTDDERKIADQFRAISVYRLIPDWVRLIDNASGFGAKREMSFKNKDWELS